MKRKTAPKRPLRATATLSAYAATKLDYKQRTASCYSAEMQRWTTYPVKNFERKILSAEEDDRRTQEIEKGLSNCLRTTTVTKPWSYTQGSSSQNNTTSAWGHFNYQSPTAKCQKHDMTYHTMKHPYVLRLKSTRKDAFFHRNKTCPPLSHGGL